MNSGLENASLVKIWELSDIDNDGYLDKEEFALVSVTDCNEYIS